MRSLQILLVGILTYASLAAARCVPNIPASCDDQEKILLSELMALGRTQLEERVRLERMELTTIQKNARSDMEKLQSEEIALRTAPRGQNIAEQRSLILKERGEWEANYSKNMTELSKQQQESAMAKGGGKEQQKAKQDLQRYVVEERRNMGKKRAQYLAEFGKKMQELSGPKVGKDMQEELQAFSAKRAQVHKDSEEKMTTQRKIIELAELVRQQPPIGSRAPVGNTVPEFMIGAKPSAGKPAGAGKPDAIFAHLGEGREAEL